MNTTSNTKLTKEQKQWLKDFKETNPNVIFYNDGVRVTIAVNPMFPKAKCFKISNSVRGDNETKFRRKVGEYYAAQRMWCRETISVSKYNFDAYDLMYQM